MRYFWEGVRSNGELRLGNAHSLYEDAYQRFAGTWYVLYLLPATCSRGPVLDPRTSRGM